jgi:hypothetical protein
MAGSALSRQRSGESLRFPPTADLVITLTTGKVGCGANWAVAAAKAERLFSVCESGPWLSMIDDRDF